MRVLRTRCARDPPGPAGEFMREATTIDPGNVPAIAAATTSHSALLDRIWARLFVPVDISFLVFFRVVFGAILAWEVSRFFSHGWIARYYIIPDFHFTYYGFHWVKPWPGQGMYIHFSVIGIAAICISLGFFYRIASAIFFFGFTYVFLLDQTRYLNHFYLVSLVSFILMFLPAQRAFSVDALIRPTIRSDAVPTWTLWLLRFQIGVAYFFGGIAKINHDWLVGGEPMRTWLGPLMKLPAIGRFFQAEWVVYSFVYSGLLLDLCVVPLLLWRRTRPFAYAAAVGFNIINALIFNIGIFPWFMLGATLVFFPPDLFRRFARAFLNPGAALRETNDAEQSRAQTFIPQLRSWQKVVAAVLIAFVVFQLLMPLRHYLYPGNVSWTEEGHNFSWHMKLRTKRGEALFTITHPPTGQTWTTDAHEHLEWRQIMKMATKPYMILQYSHYLAELKRREGYEGVEVRAHVTSTLNGRKPQLLVDPTVDLAKVDASLRPAGWIVPLTTPLEVRSATADDDDDE